MRALSCSNPQRGATCFRLGVTPAVDSRSSRGCGMAIRRTTRSIPMPRRGVMLRGARQRTGRAIRGQEVPQDGHRVTGAGRTRIGHGFLDLANGIMTHGIGGIIGENLRPKEAAIGMRSHRCTRVELLKELAKMMAFLQARCNQCKREWRRMRRREALEK